MFSARIPLVSVDLACLSVWVNNGYKVFHPQGSALGARAILGDGRDGVTGVDQESSVRDNN